MVREFKLPDVGEGVAEGEIVQWLVEAGDAVSEDQPVAEVETDKAIVEVPSPVNGTVREILADEGEVVPVGNVIITFDVEGEEPAASQTESGAVEGEAETRAETTESATGREPTESQEDVAEEPQVSEGDDTASAGGRVFAAPSARRLARELGVDISTVEGSGPSERVTDADVRAAAEGAEHGSADRSSAQGAQEGASTGQETTNETAEAEAAVAEAEEPLGGAQPTREQGAHPTTEAADRERTLAAPATRRLAREKGVDLNAVPATEERDGEAFVTPEAVEQYAERQQRAQAADAAAVGAGEPGQREERVAYRGIRRTIGEQMERSKFTAPHVTHHDTADVSNLVEARAELKARAEERGVRLTYMPFIMKALVAALKEFPYLNASLDEEAEEIIKKNYYNVGIAVATDAGLMVPVVRNVDRKGMLQLASETNELAQKARERTISMEEMQGGTFTITNFGAIGGEYATPIINYPEVAILGLGSIEKRPVVAERETPEASGTASGETASEVVARETLPLSLSIDHRVIDGAVAAQFVNRVREYLENPMLLLLQ